MLRLGNAETIDSIGLLRCYAWESYFWEGAGEKVRPILPKRRSTRSLGSRLNDPRRVLEREKQLLGHLTTGGLRTRIRASEQPKLGQQNTGALGKRHPH